MSQVPINASSLKGILKEGTSFLRNSLQRVWQELIIFKGTPSTGREVLKYFSWYYIFKLLSHNVCTSGSPHTQGIWPIPSSNNGSLQQSLALELHRRKWWAIPEYQEYIWLAVSPTPCFDMPLCECLPSPPKLYIYCCLQYCLWWP